MALIKCSRVLSFSTFFGITSVPPSSISVEDVSKGLCNVREHQYLVDKEKQALKRLPLEVLTESGPAGY